MTPFEWLSIIAYYTQLLVIGAGLWQMHRASDLRNKQLDQQGRALESLLQSQNELLRRSQAD